VQHSDTPTDQKAVEGSSDARLASRSEFEQPIAEDSRIRKPQLRVVVDQFLDTIGATGSDVVRAAQVQNG
jgi:hypothetical protein